MKGDLGALEIHDTDLLGQKDDREVLASTSFLAAKRTS